MENYINWVFYIIQRILYNKSTTYGAHTMIQGGIHYGICKTWKHRYRSIKIMRRMHELWKGRHYE